MSSSDPSPAPRLAAIVVAAGRGLRAGGGLPKQYRPLAGRPLLAWTLEALARGEIGRIVTVIHPDDRALYDNVVAALSDDARAGLVEPPTGGATRQESVRAGLAALAADPPDIVLVHDGARPFPSPALIERVVAAAWAKGAAIPTLTLADTIKQIDDAGSVVMTHDRSRLRRAQTPQAFRFDVLNSAHISAYKTGTTEFTDDAALVEAIGMRVYTVDGEGENVKITESGDFAIAEARLSPSLDDIRMGQGYDVHAFMAGDHVWLGGVRIPHVRGLAGHSDADVALHALTDAVLGAIADGDIGQHFPPTDARWKGASSDRFLADAVARVARRGGVVAHLDVTLICEAPKIGPYRDAMRARIAEIAGLSIDRVGVKATTSEGLGFAGRREGVAAMAIATVRLPGSAA